MVHAGKDASGIVSTFSHTRTKHTSPTQRLNYPSTLKSTQAGGRQTALRVCPRRRDAQRCLPARDAAGHLALVRGHLPPCLPLLSLRATRLGSLEPPRRAGSGARTSTGAAPNRPAGDEGLRGIHFPSSLGAVEPPVSLPCSRSGSAPGGASKSSARKAKEELPNLPGEGETGGEGAVCQLCAGSLSSLRVREEGLLQPGKALRLLSSSCYFLLLQWDCLATSIIPPRCVTGKILSSILMAFLRFTRPLVDLTTTITTTKASVKISSPA